MKEELEKIFDKNVQLKSEKARLKQLKIKKLIIENATLKGKANEHAK